MQLKPCRRHGDCKFRLIPLENRRTSNSMKPAQAIERLTAPETAEASSRARDRRIRKGHYETNCHFLGTAVHGAGCAA